MIFDIADRVRFLNQYVWDFTLKGADQKTVDKFRKDVTKDPPRQGGTLVHNDQVEVKAQTPDFKGRMLTVRTVEMYGAGGSGFPTHFFGDPVDANRSVAESMEGPTGKKLTERQNDLKRVVKRIIDFVIDMAILHGTLPQGVDRTYTLQVPDLMIKDLAKAATTLQGVTQSLARRGPRLDPQRDGRALRARRDVADRRRSGLGAGVPGRAVEKQTPRHESQINQLNDQANLAKALAAAKGGRTQVRRTARRRRSRSNDAPGTIRGEGEGADRAVAIADSASRRRT
jgi:hypothetical protein